MNEYCVSVFIRAILQLLMIVKPDGALCDWVIVWVMSEKVFFSGWTNQYDDLEWLLVSIPFETERN